MTSIAVCRQDTGHGWLVQEKDADGQWRVTSAPPGASPEPIIAGIIKKVREGAVSDFSFSTRRLADIEVAPIPDRPEDLEALVGASVSIMAPEGRAGDESMWNQCWLDPTGHASSQGIESRFRVKALVDQIERWFQREDYRSFTPEHHRERMSPHRISRPSHARELLIRHGWQIRALVPDAFESAENAAQREKQAAEAKARYEERQFAKSPRLRRQARQAEFAEEQRLRKIDPVALEDARKRKVWGRVGPPGKAA